MMEVPMHRVNLAAVAAVITVVLLGGCSMPVSERSVTAYEGARLIVGDGRVIENAMLVVEGTKIAQAGGAADVRVPAGATRVSLAGKTVMPMIIDTHVHLSETREALIRDLRQRAYYGVSAALSMGTDGYGLLHMRGEAIPGAARFRSAGRGITMPEPGRTTVPYWITTAAEGRKADLSWLRASLPADEFKKLEAANTDRPKAQALLGIQARNLTKLNAAGARITLGTDGNRPWGPHEEMLDMMSAGMAPMQVIVAATRNSAELLRFADAGM